MAQQNARLRLFVAVLVPKAVRKELQARQQKLREALASGTVTWTRPEHFHLTLKFLGGVDSSLVDALSVSLGKACYAFPPTDLEFRQTGFFPSSRRPRVIWIGLRAPGEWLASLQHAVETACAPFTAEKPEDRFHAHVTLGRVKQLGKRDINAMHSWADELQGRTFGRWRAREVALVRSQLLPTGAAYSTLFFAQLRSGRPQ